MTIRTFRQICNANFHYKSKPLHNHFPIYYSVHLAVKRSIKRVTRCHQPCVYVLRSVKTERQTSSVMTTRKLWRSATGIFIICRHIYIIQHQNRLQCINLIDFPIPTKTALLNVRSAAGVRVCSERFLC